MNVMVISLLFSLFNFIHLLVFNFVSDSDSNEDSEDGGAEGVAEAIEHTTEAQVK